MEELDAEVQDEDDLSRGRKTAEEEYLKPRKSMRNKRFPMKKRLLEESSSSTTRYAKANVHDFGSKTY